MHTEEKSRRVSLINHFFSAKTFLLPVIPLLLIIMVFYLITPGFFSPNLYKNGTIEEYDSDYNRLVENIRKIVSEAMENAKAEGAAAVFCYGESDKYKCSESHMNKYEFTYAYADGNTDKIDQLVANDMIATYNVLLNNRKENDEEIVIEEKDFMKYVHEYAKGLFYFDHFRFIDAVRIGTDENYYYVLHYEIEIGKRNKKFLENRISDLISYKAKREGKEKKDIQIEFHLLKQAYFETLNEMTGIGNSYPFVRENVVRRFVLEQDPYVLSRYHWGMQKALSSQNYTCLYGLKEDGSIHRGVDIAIGTGTELKAINDGIVVQADYDPKRTNTYKENRKSAGNALLVYYGVYEGKYVFYLYIHLSSINAAQNSEVKGGQLLARTGNTGYSTGPHLHWEVVFMDIDTGKIEVVNPLAYCQ